MPATLQSISGRVVSLPIYLGDPDIPEAARDPDDYFTLQYKQHGVTGKVLELAKKAEDSGSAHVALVKLCTPIFHKWDLKPGATPEQTERLENAIASGDAKAVKAIQAEIKETVDEQSPIPITEDDLLEYVPQDVLYLILMQIGESRHPNANGTGKP